MKSGSSSFRNPKLWMLWIAFAVTISALLSVVLFEYIDYMNRIDEYKSQLRPNNELDIRKFIIRLEIEADKFDQSIRFYSISAAVILIGTVMFFLALRYLQTGSIFQVSKLNRETSSDRNFKISQTEFRQIKEELEKNNDRIETIEQSIADLVPGADNLTDFEKDEIVEKIKEKVEETAAQDFISNIQNAIRNERRDSSFFDEISELHERIVRRLEFALSSLTWRGNINLLIGIFMAVSGGALLFYFVIGTGSVRFPNGSSFQEFISGFLPRISLILIIEIFAYFFLRLYSISLTEIKYFQNEITNIQSRFVALKTALHLEDEQAVRDAIYQYVRTERNFIIGKGQTTADLERSKIETVFNNSLLAAMLRGTGKNLFGRRRIF